MKFSAVFDHHGKVFRSQLACSTGGRAFRAYIVNICNGYHWSVSKQDRSVRYQPELHHIIASNRRDVRKFITIQIYISPNRWLLFKQTQPCCLNTTVALHVRRRGWQDDSTGRTSDAGLGKMGSIIPLVALDLIFADPFAGSITWFSQCWSFPCSSLEHKHQKRPKLQRPRIDPPPSLESFPVQMICIKTNKAYYFIYFSSIFTLSLGLCFCHQCCTWRQKRNDNIISITSTEK